MGWTSSANIWTNRQSTRSNPRADAPTRLDSRCSPTTLSLPDARWSSLVARRAHNPKVVGSNPTRATKRTLKRTDRAPLVMNRGVFGFVRREDGGVRQSDGLRCSVSRPPSTSGSQLRHFGNHSCFGTIVADWSPIGCRRSGTTQSLHWSLRLAAKRSAIATLCFSRSRSARSVTSPRKTSSGVRPPSAAFGITSLCCRT